MGYCEASVGVGLMIGPVLGSLVFGFVGYEYTFYVFGALIGVGLITVYFLLPARLNHVGGPAPHDPLEELANGGSRRSLNQSEEIE